MKTFDVYKHPVRGYQAVKHGFSWPAFSLTIFSLTFIWAFFKRMWGFGFASFGIYLALYIVPVLTLKSLLQSDKEAEGIGALIILILIFAFCIIVGFKANGWQRRNLIKRGYEQAGIVETVTPDAAIAEIVKKQVPANA